MSETRGTYQAGAPRRVWAQGDCVAYDVEDPVQACRMYRRDMAHAQIGISTHNPDALRVREYAAELEAARDEIARLRGVLESVDGDLEWILRFEQEGTHQPAHVAWHRVKVDIPDAARRGRETISAALAAQPAGKESGA